MKADLITPSFRGDLELARDLCTSVDRFVDPDIGHVVLVPRRDLRMFSSLSSPRRRFVALEDVLPSWFVRLPLPHRLRIPGLIDKRLREVWLTPASMPVRGWIVQQIAKMAAPAYSQAEVFVFADSDVVFVRPFGPADFEDGGNVRLFRRPGVTEELRTHRTWHRESAKLLGLPETHFFGADYIGNLITWRRDTLQALHARLSEIGKADWRLVIARTLHLSEYILYGVFAEHVMANRSGHYFSDADLCHCSWHYDLTTPAGLDHFVQEFPGHSCSFLIQSTDPLSLSERRALISRLTAATAAHPTGAGCP